MVNKVAMLTAGGFAPCLSSAIGGLIERYSDIAPDVEIIAYRHGYEGLLKGDSITVTPAVRQMLREVKNSGRDPLDVVRELQNARKKKRRDA